MLLAGDLGRRLEDGAASLDIPIDVAEEAILRYEEVAAWLREEGSTLRPYSPEIYPQGSFRIGTAIRPLAPQDEFDIDLVCRLIIAKESTTQKDLKGRVGTRLREDAKLAEILQEKRRCWTLTYSGRFHLDILPGIPDATHSSESILVTDRDLTRWQHSDPIAYSEWFFSRMGDTLREQTEVLAKAAGIAVEEVPRWQVRTPLQRTVQLLKRCRDLRFACDDEKRPVSIIITTLAAWAYGGERDIQAALAGVVKRMSRFIERRNGQWWVANPAHEAENFADRWNEKPELVTTFVNWLGTLDRELDDVALAKSTGVADQMIARNFGSGGQLVSTGATVPALADASHCQRATWSERLSGRCDVEGWIHPSVRKGRALWKLRGGASVPKHVGIRFKATTNVSPPFEVRWQVVNTGGEASAKGQLRGGFDESEPGQDGIRWESTAYLGTHWIEAFVLKDGWCVARSGRKLIRIRR